MRDRRQRQPAGNEAPHTVPKDAAVLAPSRQRAMPKPADSEPKNPQRRVVHRHSVVAKASTYNRPQPLALFRDGFVHSSLKFGFHFIQLRPYRLPQHREPSIASFLYADMRETQEAERLRFSCSTPLPLVGSRARCLRTCTGSLTARDSGAPRDIGAPDGAFRFLLQRRRPGGMFLRGSIPGPHAPLSTLRHRPRGRLRMTRGRCGSLLHFSMTLSFTTPRRFNRRTGEGT
jgi:hypothetical protein